MTMATIGRRTKKAATALLPRLLGGFGAGIRRRGLLRNHRHARPDALESLDHDLVAGLQSLLDDPEIPFHRSGLDDLDRHFVVRAEDRDLVAALKLRHGPLRHEDRA